MIHRTQPINLTENWQQQLSSLISSPEALFDFLELDAQYLPAAQKAHTLFPVRVTHAYANRITKGDLNDPLLAQILPLNAETEEVAGYSHDPLNEVSSNTSPGIVHKYHGRLLLITATQCAINCRYCFRRHFNYSDNHLSRQQWQEALTYIAKDSSIDEVILSGGDPLAISDSQLHWLITELEKIPHVTRLRVHTRLPIVLPSRITQKLLDTFAECRFLTVFVVHCNHPKELDASVTNAFEQIKSSGITLLNQTVLLKGINDNGEVLAQLSRALFSCGALPYYLHLLDKVSGAAHFDVDENTARELYQYLLHQLPGYLVPKLVREDPNEASKVPVV